MSFSNPEEKGRPITVEDEGVPISSNVGKFNFTGSGVTGSAIGTNVTEDVPGSSGGSNIKKSIHQVAHGFSTQQAVYYTGSIWALAKADAEGTLGIGVIIKIGDDDFDVYSGGEITGLSGLTSGQYYFVSDATAGLLTATEPTTATSFSNPILQATSTTTGIILPFRPSTVASSVDNIVTAAANFTDNEIVVAAGANKTVDNGAAAGLNLSTATAPSTPATDIGRVFNLQNGTGIDHYTKLCLHMEGANNAQVFTDSSFTKSPYDTSYRKTVTANGNVLTSTAQKKLGTSSAYFDGNGDYLSIPDSSDWDLGSGDFTIDTWVRFSSVTTNQAIFSQYELQGGANNIWTFAAWDGAAVTKDLFFYSMNPTVLAWYKYTWNPTQDQWYHIAFVRSGTNVYLYIDGVKITWTTVTQAIGSSTLANIVGNLTIGRSDFATGGSNRDLNGYIDEFRWSKGIARWTGATFTPPTTPYDGLNLKITSAEGDTWLLAGGTN